MAAISETMAGNGRLARALGILEYNQHMVPVDLFQFCDTRLSPKVKHGLHGMAIDEERISFTPTLEVSEPRITQVLFPGSSDGGGVAHRPWTHLPWVAPESQPRVLPRGFALHRSVADRLARGPLVGEPGAPPARYAPGNLVGYVAAGRVLPGIIVT